MVECVRGGGGGGYEVDGGAEADNGEEGRECGEIWSSSPDGIDVEIETLPFRGEGMRVSETNQHVVATYQ